MHVQTTAKLVIDHPEDIAALLLICKHARCTIEQRARSPEDVERNGWRASKALRVLDWIHNNVPEPRDSDSKP